MKSPKHTEPSQESRPETQQVSERRRKLLRAAAASAPVIATLRSGAAMANVSAYQCLINDDNRDDSLVQLTEGARQPGGWLQIPVARRKYTGTYTCTLDGPDGDSEPGDGCTPTAQPNTPKLVWDVLIHEGIFYNYDSNKQYLDASNVVPDPEDLPSSGTGWNLSWTYTEEPPVWAIAYYLRMDDYTDIIAGPDLLQRGNDDWQALTGSCWTSLGGLGDA